MIEEIVLNCGPAEGSAPLRLAGTPGVTILVGPNNCGKSALLEAIYNKLAGQGDKAKPSTLAAIGFHEMTDEIIGEHPLFRDRVADDPITVSSFITAPKSDWLLQIRSNPHGPWAKAFRGESSIWLNGAQRLAMLPSETNANLQAPVGPLGKLFVDDARRLLFQTAVFAGIGHYPVLDSVSAFGTLSLAFSSEKPDPVTERNLGAETLTYMTKSGAMREFG